MPSPTPIGRTVAQVDAALKLQRNDRQRCLQQIDTHLAEIDRLRRDHAKASRRIDELLEEREQLTAPDVPDVPSSLDTTDAQ
jgi:hypothetical protein